MTDRERLRPSIRSSRLILMAGFGGLLLMMAFVGLDAVRVLRVTQDRNETIRKAFLARNSLLNHLRSNLYLSGTYVRDYLLEPDMAAAGKHLMSLRRTRLEMERGLADYRALLAPEEADKVEALRQQMADYWDALAPVMQWEPDRRRSSGYSFLRDEVFPRRMAMLSMADQISAVDERQLTLGNEQVSDLFAEFQVRLTFTLIVTLSLGGLLAAFSMRKILSLELDSAHRFEEIAKAQEELKELSARLLAVQENERRLIARELHDEVGQSLSALRLGLTNLTALLPATVASGIAEQMQSLCKVAETSMGVVRNITLLLRPSMLDDLGLVPALQWQAREVSRHSGLLVQVAADTIPETISEEQKTCIYRVVQEALHNCVRHAAARHVRVNALCEDNQILLSIQDDGRGFDAERDRGLGLLGMQERVTHLKGTFSVNSEPGRGTVITIALPLPPGSEKELTLQ